MGPQQGDLTLPWGPQRFSSFTACTARGADAGRPPGGVGSRVGGQRGDPQMRRLLSLDPLLHTLDTAPAERPAGGAEARAGGVEGRAAEEEGAPDACEGCRQVSAAEPAAALEPQLSARPCTSGRLLVQAPHCPHVGSSPSHVLGTAAAGPPGPGTTGRRAPRRRAAKVPMPGSCGDTHKPPPGSPVSPHVNTGSSGHTEGHRSP